MPSDLSRNFSAYILFEFIFNNNFMLKALVEVKYSHRLKNTSRFPVENSNLLMTLVLVSAQIFQECCNALDYSTLLESHTQKGQENQ